MRLPIGKRSCPPVGGPARLVKANLHFRIKKIGLFSPMCREGERVADAVKREVHCALSVGNPHILRLSETAHTLINSGDNALLSGVLLAGASGGGYLARVRIRKLASVLHLFGGQIPFVSNSAVSFLVIRNQLNGLLTRTLKSAHVMSDELFVQVYHLPFCNKYTMRNLPCQGEGEKILPLKVKPSRSKPFPFPQHE